MLYGVKLLLPVFLTSEVYLKQRIQKILPFYRKYPWEKSSEKNIQDIDF
jgi:hypothetical protein